jgi:hypothetical protein
MRVRKTLLLLLVGSGMLLAQTPTPVPATLAQVMKGILFPNSNVVFAAQGQNPADVKPDSDPGTALNPLASDYGKWEAVENSALALAESASLLNIAGRKCLNGRPVPTQNADWVMFVQALRDAGTAAYKAAQSKNQDNILEATDKIDAACSNCHVRYRNKDGGKNRCI